MTNNNQYERHLYTILLDATIIFDHLRLQVLSLKEINFRFNRSKSDMYNFDKTKT
jgi:hypothetical protein